MVHESGYDHPTMRTLLTSLAVLALVFVIGCGGDDDKTGDGCGDGCGPAKADDTTPAKAGDGTPPAKTDGDAAKMVTYKCAMCPKTKQGAEGAAAPS